MGPPFDRRTWSGASHHLFTALRRSGSLAGVVDARPPDAVWTLAKALAVAPDRHRWRERYEYSPLLRGQAERFGARAMRRVDLEPDVLLQVGAYYDFTRRPQPRPKLRASFHDANLALFQRSGVFVEDPDAPHVRSMMRHEVRVLAGLDLVMPMSQWLADSFVDDFGLDPDRVVVVGSGVNSPELPAPASRDWSTPRLLFVGFDGRRKGLPVVRDAWRRLRRDHPGATLTVVGPPRPADADEPGLHWVGPVDRSTAEGESLMARLHRESTVFVMVPTYDPMPNAVLEAMAHGLPVVAPRRGSMPEMVLDLETGLLSDDVDAATVAARIGDLARDPDRARTMGEKGRERVLAHFTWDHVASRMLEAMQARIEGAQRRPRAR